MIIDCNFKMTFHILLSVLMLLKLFSNNMVSTLTQKLKQISINMFAIISSKFNTDNENIIFTCTSESTDLTHQKQFTRYHNTSCYLRNLLIYSSTVIKSSLRIFLMPFNVEQTLPDDSNNDDKLYMLKIMLYYDLSMDSVASCQAHPIVCGN